MTSSAIGRACARSVGEHQQHAERPCRTLLRPSAPRSRVSRDSTWSIRSVQRPGPNASLDASRLISACSAGASSRTTNVSEFSLISDQSKSQITSVGGGAARRRRADATHWNSIAEPTTTTLVASGTAAFQRIGTPIHVMTSRGFPGGANGRRGSSRLLPAQLPRSLLPCHSALHFITLHGSTGVHVHFCII